MRYENLTSRRCIYFFNYFTPPQYHFTESKLIHFVTTRDYSSLQELFEETTKLSGPLEGGLQITEIAINEGSTKTFINSILTETIQNSLDAIRTESPMNKYIDLRLKEVAGREIIFSITDYVGMENGWYYCYHDTLFIIKNSF